MVHPFTGFRPTSRTSTTTRSTPETPAAKTPATIRAIATGQLYGFLAISCSESAPLQGPRLLVTQLQECQQLLGPVDLADGSELDTDDVAALHFEAEPIPHIRGMLGLRRSVGRILRRSPADGRTQRHLRWKLVRGRLSVRATLELEDGRADVHDAFRHGVTGAPLVGTDPLSCHTRGGLLSPANPKFGRSAWGHQGDRVALPVVSHGSSESPVVAAASAAATAPWRDHLAPPAGRLLLDNRCAEPGAPSQTPGAGGRD